MTQLLARFRSDRGARRQLFRARPSVMVLAMLGLLPNVAHAQEPVRGTSIRDLPRPGFETGRWRFGSTTLYPVVTASAALDDNLFATSTDAESVGLFHIRPQLDAVTQGQRLTIESGIYADARVHSRFSSEDRLTFGLGTRGNYALGRADNVNFGLRFDRGAQPRTDPESDPELRRPARFDNLQADLGFRHRGRRIGYQVRGTVQRVNFLPSDSDDINERNRLEDQDVISYQLPVRLSWIASPRISLFVEPFVNRRDARRATDRTGIDRDTTTIGAMGGVALDIADRWKGELGAGGFRANPDEPTLDSFSGLSLSGSLRWSPVPRTAVTFSAFSGDVATVRAGASGRIDTRLGLRVDQEIRHNLLANAGIGWRQTRYRTIGGVGNDSGPDNRLRSLALDGEVEWLINRNFSLFGTVQHENRRATLVRDRFNRTIAGIGIRWRT